MQKLDFIRTTIQKDLDSGLDSIRTRFPPEPNGYLHIGHAKSICLNFSLASEVKNGLCNLRFDDTNPLKENEVFVESIKEDISWLGFDWEDRLFFASDYFDQLYEWAIYLIMHNFAYVDSQTSEEISENRGHPTKKGKNSPYRDRSTVENLKLFQEMKDGLHKEGSHVLRAKIDMGHANLNMRDPILYRIRHKRHQRTGTKWCIYPMYDWAHGQSDAIEGITHSICTLEFENHRPLYEWFLEKLNITHPPRQIEFARLNMSYTVTSKRILRELVEEGYLESWDDPRMPTISGLRRRGCPPSAIRRFAAEVGVTKTESVVEHELLDFCIREELNRSSRRVMSIIEPIKLCIINYPESEVEMIEAVNNPEDPRAGTRKLPFSRELYIDAQDFMIDPPKKYFRLAKGREVRLKHAYYVRCIDFLQDEHGKVYEVHCTYDPASKGGQSPDGRKVKGTIQWLSAEHARDAEFRLYDTLFLSDNPAKISEDFRSSLNPNSLKVVRGKVEPSLAEAKPEERFQFMRIGYFCADRWDYSPKSLVFNRTIGLKDTWSKIQSGGG